jgi:serine/threonine protein kinase
LCKTVSGFSFLVSGSPRWTELETRNQKPETQAVTVIGTEIASYRILEKLGEGGMGTVYKAVDTALDRMVAIKVLSSDLSGNSELVQRFKAEAKAQANLNHTNLATLYAFVIQEDRACMVMELVDGETFEQMILRRGPVAVHDALPLFKQALLGIGYAHRAGIVHRDIKPSNLMVNRLGIVKVMDFGIAKVMGARGMTRTGVQMGTGWYMSPEQVLNRPVDIRSDIYSLGVTLYQMITAHVPFDGPSDYQIMTDHVSTPPPLPTSFAPNIPKGVENAVLKALDKNADARFQTVEEFGAALERPEDFGAAAIVPAAVVGCQVLEPQINVARRTPGLLATPERKVVAGAAGLAVVLFAGWMTMRSRTPTPVASISPPVGSSTSVQPSSAGGEIAPPLSQQQPLANRPARQPISRVLPVTPQIRFSAVPNSIAPGGTTRLRWVLTNTRSAKIVPAPGLLRQNSGEFLVAPAQTTTYTLTAASKDGTLATATATVQVLPAARPDFAVLVHHDHGFSQVGWAQCWGQLMVVGNSLQYRVVGTSDGRRDGFNIPLSQLQDVRMNRVPIRNFPGFHVTINGRVFNFVPQGMPVAQVVFAIQQRIGAR